jgi:hypothetical protein
MVVVAWIGHRLEGRFAVEWGKAGTELAFRATVKPARGELPILSVSPAKPDPGTSEPTSSSDDPIIEGEAHTVEIDVGELKALIAAVEAEPPPVCTEPEAHQIRVHRVVNGNGNGHDGLR